MTMPEPKPVLSREEIKREMQAVSFGIEHREWSGKVDGLMLVETAISVTERLLAEQSAKWLARLRGVARQECDANLSGSEIVKNCIERGNPAADTCGACRTLARMEGEWIPLS